MGAVAAEVADHVVVTSDNPRSEDPGRIIEEIVAGVGQGTVVEVEPDRRLAIRRALTAALPGDVVVIAGKGHEHGQTFANGTVPFSDREEAAEALRSLAAGAPA
jgi:UDP-N-acetylmuramoyl-L-alanyl-D-glutamate--2,6-diaminopimelate ligase